MFKRIWFNTGFNFKKPTECQDRLPKYIVMIMKQKELTGLMEAQKEPRYRKDIISMSVTEMIKPLKTMFSLHFLGFPDP